MASRPTRASLRAAAPPASGRATAAGASDASLRRGFAVRLALLGLVFVAALVFGYVRQVPAPSAIAAGPAAPAAEEARAALFRAAQHLEARLGDGDGLSFTATQVQMLRPEPGGPQLLYGPDRENPDRTPQPVDQIVLGTMSGRGAAGPGAFFAEWFEGADDGGRPTFDGEAAYAGLVRDGELWRQDHGTNQPGGAGWNASADIPGFGVDPASLRELPELLRRLREPAFLGQDAEGRHWGGLSDAVWYPGAVAVDGAPFTGTPITIEIWLDDADRLVGLYAVARNINETTYQLLCVNRVFFTYQDGPPPIPEPVSP